VDDVLDDATVADEAAVVALNAAEDTAEDAELGA